MDDLRRSHTKEIVKRWDLNQPLTESVLKVRDRVTGEEVWLVDHWTLQRSSGSIDEIRPSRERAEQLAERARATGDSLIGLAESELTLATMEGWSSRAIELAFGYFARTCADSLVVRREIFESAIRGMEEPELISDLPVVAWTVPKTSKDYLRLCRTSIDFNRQLFSVIAMLEGVGRKHADVKAGDPPVLEQFGEAPLSGAIGGPAARKYLSCAEVEACNHTHCAENLFATWHLWFLWVITLGRTRVEAKGVLQPRIGSPDMESRSRKFGESGASYPGDWRALQWLIPMGLFEDLEQAVDTGYRAPAPRRWIGQISSLDSDHVKLAVHSQRGAEIYFTQHGGYYGDSIQKPSESHERSASNGFITWGWKDGEDCIPLPAPRLRHRRDRFRMTRIRGLLKRNRSAKRSIVWVTQDALPWDFQLPPRSIGGRAYTNSCLEFRGALSQTLEKRIVVRYRPDKLRVEDDHLRRPHGAVFDGLSIADPQASVHDLLESASLVVLDQAFTTTFLECLSRDIPVIAFDPISFAYTRPERKPIYDELLAAEVIHTDPARAADILEAIIEDVPAWWKEPSRRRAITHARAELAQTDPRYFSRWRAFLTSGPGESAPSQGRT